MDLRIVPVFALLYLVSHIDRGNLGNAKIEGLSKSLHLVGNQYNIASTVFFVPYILFGQSHFHNHQLYRLTKSRNPIEHGAQEDAS